MSLFRLIRPLVSAKQRSRTASLHACVKCRTWTRGNYHRRCLGLRKVPLVVQSSAGKRLGACPQNRVALCTAWGISMMKPSLGIQRPRALTVGCQNILPATSGADSWFRRGLNLVLARSVCRNCALVALTVIVQTVVGPLWICSRPIPRFRCSACRKLVCGLISLLRSRLRPLQITEQVVLLQCRLRSLWLLNCKSVKTLYNTCIFGCFCSSLDFWVGVPLGPRTSWLAPFFEVVGFFPTLNRFCRVARRCGQHRVIGPRFGWKSRNCARLNCQRLRNVLIARDSARNCSWFVPQWVFPSMSFQSKRLVSRFKAAEGFVPPRELVGIGDRGGERSDGDQLTFKLSFRRKKSFALRKRQWQRER